MTFKRFLLLQPLITLIFPLLLPLLFWSEGGFAQSRAKVPPLTSPVMDQVGLLVPETRAALEKTLRELQKFSGTQLTVLAVPDTQDLSIEEFSIAVVDSWKLGAARTDRGLLFLISSTTRKLRIEVGQGLEGELTDLDSKRIIDDVVVPLFRKGDFNEGILLGVYSIVQKTDPEFSFENHLQQGDLKALRLQPEGGRERASSGQIVLIIIFVFIFLVLKLLSFLGGGGGGGGPYYGGGGFGGGGFGGRSGGGWSGGGGGFSGGGASGGW